MTEINPLIKTTLAGQIAQQLDANDGQVDGKISASIWDAFVVGKGGKTINDSITIEQAMNSIITYAIRNQTANKSVDATATEWLNAAKSATPTPTPTEVISETPTASTTVSVVAPAAKGNIPPAQDPNPPAMQSNNIPSKYDNDIFSKSHIYNKKYSTPNCEIGFLEKLVIGPHGYVV